MGHEGKKINRRAWMFAGAFATALSGTPVAFRDSASAQTAGGVSYESLAQRPGGNYIRSTDTDTRAQVLTRLGDAPFAANRSEAFENLEQAVDALMRSENIPAQYRDQILATLRGSSNFTNYNIRGVAPDEMSSTEVVDAMLSRGGHVTGEGVGQNVRMETPVVPGTRTGHTGYRAERWVVEAVIDGRQVLMVFTRPEECNNFSVKIIDREQAPLVAPTEVAPCIDVVIDNTAITRAGGRVIAASSGVVRIARHDGQNLTPAETQIFRTCNARTQEISGNPVHPCEDCTLGQNERRLTSLIVFTERTGLVARTRINPADYGAALISRFRLEPQSDGRVMFSSPTPTPDGSRVYEHPFWCEDIELANGEQYRLEMQGEEDVNKLNEAAHSDARTMTVRIGESSVWQRIGAGNTLSDERYNFRNGRMVQDRNWNPGTR